MKVTYYTSFYSGECEPRFARMHDVWHFLNRQKKPPFDYNILASTGKSIDSPRVEIPLKFLDSFISVNSMKGKKGVVIGRLKGDFLKKQLHNGDFDVFHSVTLSPLTLDHRYLAFVKKKTDAKTVVGPNLLGYYKQRKGPLWDSENMGPTEKLKRLREYEYKKKYLNSELVDEVLAIGQYHKLLLSEIGVPELKISLLPPAVDPKYFGFEGDRYRSQSDFTILYVGSFTKYKGIDVFLKALEFLDKETDIDFEAVLCGLGPYDPIENHRKIKDRLNVVGYVPRSKIAGYYRGADVYVHPSIDEVGAGTMIESLACGTPCIATDRLCFREYDTQKVCRFFKERNHVDLKNNLVKVYGERYSRKNIDCSGYQINNNLIRYLDRLYGS